MSFSTRSQSLPLPNIVGRESSALKAPAAKSDWLELLPLELVEADREAAFEGGSGKISGAKGGSKEAAGRLTAYGNQTLPVYRTLEDSPDSQTFFSRRRDRRWVEGCPWWELGCGLAA